MQDEEFLDTVRRNADLESEESAREVALATLETLGERITDGQAAEVAAALPDGMADPLADPNVGEAETFDLEEFVDRVADRAGVGEAAVPVHTAAVFDAVAEADEDGNALAGAREQLPPAFDALFEPGALVREEAFLERVEDRAGLSTDEARETTLATLRTLSEALTGGQAADLASYLPVEFEGALTESDPSEAAGYSTEEFLDRVGDRTDVDDPEAGVRVVLATVSEAVSDRELENARKQLPDPFGDLFEPEG